MKTGLAFFAALGAVPSILAHTVFTNFYVDGVDQVCLHKWLFATCINYAKG
jgi:hypothetical protein